MQGEHGTIASSKNKNRTGLSMNRSHTSAVRPTRVARLVRAASVVAGFTMLGLLSACSDAPPLFAADGRPTTLVQCPAGSDNCEQQAGAACSGAFEVLRQTTDNGQRSVLYACKAH